MRATIQSFIRSDLFHRVVVVTTLGLLAAAAPTPAPQCPEFKPTPEHAVLAAAQGSFALSFSDGNAGSSSSTLGLGGQWLLEHVQADFQGHAYEGRGATSYDPVRGKYIGVWIDSVSPVPLVSEGTYDPATRTLTLVGDMVMPHGGTAKATLVTVYQSEDARTFSLRVPGPDGEGIALFEIQYTRRAR